MHRPVLITPPSTTPVTLAEAKAQLDIDYADKDDLIVGLIEAAVSHLDGWTGNLGGRCLMEQSWRQDFDGLARCLRLPLFPAISIASVKYDDVDDAEQTIAASNYSLLTDALGAYVRFKDAYSFPALHDDPPAVRVTYVAGYADAAAVPAALKQAMLLLIRHWFDNPAAVAAGASVQAMPLAVDSLLSGFRPLRL